jgi:KDO2-lipid IV(A) lauroyltransferase
MAAGRFAMAGVMKVADRLNPGRIDWWGKRLGDLMFFGSRRYRTVASKNLTNAFPDWDRGRVMRVARDTFRSFARGALEFFHLLHLPAEELGDWITIEGTEHLDAALAKGHGVILITAHFGNWEVFARKLVLLGYPVNVIARDSDDPGMTGIGNAVRQSGGYRVLPRDDAALPAMRCLRKNELLGILPDQNTWSGIFVDFFGRPVATATGPAVFALRSGAPIVCGFARRDESGRFGAVIYPPLEVSMSGDEDTDIQRLTEAFTDVIEDEIRKYPEQWLWVHDRWRRTDEAPDRKAVLEKIS